MSKIGLQDTMMDVMVKMADGNPGAITVLMDLMRVVPTVDPASALGWLGPILLLDDENIRGSNIWVLYKDICGSDTAKVVLLLRAAQLGIIPFSDLHERISAASTRRADPFDFAAVLKSVRKELPECFGGVLIAEDA